MDVQYMRFKETAATNLSANYAYRVAVFMCQRLRPAAPCACWVRKPCETACASQLSVWWTFAVVRCPILKTEFLLARLDGI
eukprot:11454524-Karenia_brevis.AAC.1